MAEHLAARAVTPGFGAYVSSTAQGPASSAMMRRASACVSGSPGSISSQPELPSYSISSSISDRRGSPPGTPAAISRTAKGSCG
ncbi:hypothetical protein ACRAWF_38300 [Streptomyces sp. L7]